MRLAAEMIPLGRREGAERSNAHAWWLCATISLCQARTTSKTTQGEYKNVILWNLSSAVCFSYITEPVTKFINFCTLQMKICFI